MPSPGGGHSNIQDPTPTNYFLNTFNSKLLVLTFCSASQLIRWACSFEIHKDCKNQRAVKFNLSHHIDSGCRCSSCENLISQSEFALDGSSAPGCTAEAQNVLLPPRRCSKIMVKWHANRFTVYFIMLKAWEHTTLKTG